MVDNSPQDTATPSAPQPTPAPSMGEWAIWWIGIYILASILVEISLIVEFWPIKEGEGDARKWKDYYELLKFYKFDVSPQGRIIVLVLLAGGLGGIVDVLREYTLQTRRHALKKGAGWWFVLRPFEGAVIALIFYFVVGVHPDASADTDKVYENIFGGVAVAALVGLFSQQAVRKLQEVAETLFATARGKLANGGETRTGLAITGLDPDKLSVGSGKLTVTVIGTGFTADSKILVDGAERDTSHVSATELRVTLLPTDVAAAGVKKISARDEKTREVSRPVNLTIEI